MHMLNKTEASGAAVIDFSTTYNLISLFFYTGNIYKINTWTRDGSRQSAVPGPRNKFWKKKKKLNVSACLLQEIIYFMKDSKALKGGM